MIPLEACVVSIRWEMFTYKYRESSLIWFFFAPYKYNIQNPMSFILWIRRKKIITEERAQTDYRNIPVRVYEQHKCLQASKAHLNINVPFCFGNNKFHFPFFCHIFFFFVFLIFLRFVWSIVDWIWTIRIVDFIYLCMPFMLLFFIIIFCMRCMNFLCTTKQCMVERHTPHALASTKNCLWQYYMNLFHVCPYSVHSHRTE